MADANDYEPEEHHVGYGKPPKQSQFKKGRSGNPRGRPKGSGVASAIERVAGRTVTVTVDGRRQKVPVTQAMVMQLAQRGLAGDAVATRDFLKIASQAAQARAANEEKGGRIIVELMQFGEPTDCCGALEVLGIVSIVSGHYKIQPWAVEAAKARNGKIHPLDAALVADNTVKPNDELTGRDPAGERGLRRSE